MLYLTDLGAADPDKIFESGVCLKECPAASDSPKTYETPSLDAKSIEMKTTYKSKVVLQYCFPDFESD